MAQSVILPPGMTPEQVRTQLNRILDSEVFRRAGRLSRFLEYVISASLNAARGVANEYSIARDVFDKTDTFDPRADPIVRVEAGRLRTKIREYYATAGASDTVFVGIRNRGYLPLIRSMNPVAHNRRGSAAADQSKRFIAVLNVRDLSPQSSRDPFCEGLTHEIQTRLIQGPSLSGLSVIGRPLARLLDAESADFLEKAREFGVEQVLEGRVQRIDGEVRLTAELTDVRTGRSVWAQSVDGPLGDLLQLQRELANRIVADLRQTLRPAELTQ